MIICTSIKLEAWERRNGKKKKEIEEDAHSEGEKVQEDSEEEKDPEAAEGGRV